MDKEAAADHRSDVGDPSSRKARRRPRGIVASAYAGAQAKDAGRCRIGQQDGAYGLGHNDKR